jgi:hypothetical protein
MILLEAACLPVYDGKGQHFVRRTKAAASLCNSTTIC